MQPITIILLAAGFLLVLAGFLTPKFARRTSANSAAMDTSQPNASAREVYHTKPQIDHREKVAEVAVPHQTTVKDAAIKGDAK